MAEKEKTPKRWPTILQGICSLFFIIVGKLGDADFIVSASAPGHWMGAKMKFIGEYWSWVQPTLMIALIFAILWLEKKNNEAKFPTNEELATERSSRITLDGTVAQFPNTIDAMRTDIENREAKIFASIDAIKNETNETLANLNSGLKNIAKRIDAIEKINSEFKSFKELANSSYESTENNFRKYIERLEIFRKAQIFLINEADINFRIDSLLSGSHEDYKRNGTGSGHWFKSNGYIIEGIFDNVLSSTGFVGQNIIDAAGLIAFDNTINIPENIMANLRFIAADEADYNGMAMRINIILSKRRALKHLSDAVKALLEKIADEDLPVNIMPPPLLSG